MKAVVSGLAVVFLINLFLYLWVQKFNSIVSLSPFYSANHHYYEDGRIKGEGFDMLRAWGQTDSQWYLKIAAAGYGEPGNLNMLDKKMEGLSYAFFPLYPVLIRLLSCITFRDYEIAAFLLGNFIMLGIWVSVYCVVSKIYSPKYAALTGFLILTYPFSLFLRSYHAEGIYLLEFVWWLYFLSRKNFAFASLSLGMMNITKGTGWLLNLIFIYSLYKEVKSKNISLYKGLLYLAISLLPIGIWILYVFVSTGDPFYFYKAVSQWKIAGLPVIFFNMYRLVQSIYFLVTGHWVNAMQGIVFAASIYILILSRKQLRPEWWWSSFLLLLIPTITTYSVGFTSGRLGLVQIPLWVYLASRLKKKSGFFLIAFFVINLFAGSIYFVNWYWWG